MTAPQKLLLCGCPIVTARLAVWNGRRVEWSESLFVTIHNRQRLPPIAFLLENEFFHSGAVPSCPQRSCERAGGTPRLLSSALCHERCPLPGSIFLRVVNDTRSLTVALPAFSEALSFMVVRGFSLTSQRCFRIEARVMSIGKGTDSVKTGKPSPSDIAAARSFARSATDVTSFFSSVLHSWLYHRVA